MPQRATIAGLCRTIFVNTPVFALAGAPAAVIVAFQYGLPTHAVVTFFVMVLATGLGTTLGFHRLFAHRAFATTPPVERALMILGCMAGQNGPFYWVASHRLHHRHSDHDGDPHSPYVWRGRRLGMPRGFWHAYFGWLHANGYDYPTSVVRDLTRRADFVWLDRHWFHLYLAGLAIPALVGLAVGGTAYDALIGLLWGGLFRQFLGLQASFAVNSVCHLWGSRPYDTADRSRNNFVVGVVAFGEGWHNNHHAYPSSARHGFHWWQPDLTWSVIWLMERVGLAWDVKRPGPLAYASRDIGAKADA